MSCDFSARLSRGFYPTFTWGLLDGMPGVLFFCGFRVAEGRGGMVGEAEGGGW